MKIFEPNVLFSVSFVFVFLLLSVHTRRLEENYIIRNGNKDLPPWDLIRKMLNETNGVELMKEYCRGWHKKFGLGDKIIETASLKRSYLTFRMIKYQPMMVDVLTYGIDLEGKDPLKYRKFWHIMQGNRASCVWYLDPVNGTEFELREYACEMYY